jgi:hypothetical protein
LSCGQSYVLLLALSVSCRRAVSGPIHARTDAGVAGAKEEGSMTREHLRSSGTRRAAVLAMALGLMTGTLVPGETAGADGVSDGEISTESVQNQPDGGATPDTTGGDDGAAFPDTADGGSPSGGVDPDWSNAPDGLNSITDGTDGGVWTGPADVTTTFDSEQGLDQQTWVSGTESDSGGTTAGAELRDTESTPASSAGSDMDVHEQHKEEALELLPATS